MARPARHNAEYFYHPADFRNDRRVKAIRARYGATGYGLLLMLLEVLTDADHTRVDLANELELELLAGDLNTSAEELSELLAAAQKVGLLAKSEAGQLSSGQLDTWLEPVFEKRNRSRNTPKLANLPQAAAETGVSATVIPPVQNSTAQNSTEEKNIESVSASEEDELAADVDFYHGLTPDGEEQPPESPGPELRTPGGSADVPTSIVPTVDYTDISPALILPFQSDAFRAGWAKWRQYNHEEQERPLGGGMREQEALRKCGLLAKQDEKIALAIIDQAISKGWKDLFPLDSSSPAFTETTTATPQRHAVSRSTYGNQANSAAARLHTPKPTAEAGWGYPGG